MLSRYRKELNLRFDAIARRITFISPNTLTLLNLLFSLVPGFLYYTRHFQLAGISLLIFSALDVLDGAVARVTDSVSAFGGFLDSTVDRVADFVILGSIALSQVVDWRIVLFAAFGSFMVPYCRARGEAAVPSSRQHRTPDLPNTQPAPDRHSRAGDPRLDNRYSESSCGEENPRWVDRGWVVRSYR